MGSILRMASGFETDAGAGADHDDGLPEELRFARDGRCSRGGAHVGSFVPACSATIYSAYQSAQFSSRCPRRFSCSPWAASARRNALARSVAEANEVAAGSTRPGKRVVISCTSQPLPSGSLKVAKER